ncbi:MAG: hypothetical protein C0436_04135 [Alphaproteobacteria bacterium]|nr:hypothetical protein [Alphaproteobacteria bacterium]
MIARVLSGFVPALGTYSTPSLALDRFPASTDYTDTQGSPGYALAPHVGFGPFRRLGSARLAPAPWFIPTRLGGMLATPSAHAHSLQCLVSSGLVVSIVGHSAIGVRPTHTFGLILTGSIHNGASGTFRLNLQAMNRMTSG